MLRNSAVDVVHNIVGVITKSQKKVFKNCKAAGHEAYAGAEPGQLRIMLDCMPKLELLYLDHIGKHIEASPAGHCYVTRLS